MYPFEQYILSSNMGEVHLDAIINNIQSTIRILPNETKMMAVVKANGYGMVPLSCKQPFKQEQNLLLLRF